MTHEEYFQMKIDKAFQLAYQYYQSGDLNQASNVYKKILRVQLGNIDALHFLGGICYKLGDYDSSINYIKKELQLNQPSAEAYNKLGNIMKKKGMLEEAINYYQKALQINPNHPGILNNLGNVLYEIGCFDKALISYQNALQLDPDSPYSHFHMSRVLLLSGNYKQGWKEYEWRWKTKDYFERDFSKPLWDGSDFSGKTILIHTEQGLGDAIQFIRYVPLVVQHGATIIVECQKELVSLFQNVEGVKQVIARGNPLIHFDLHCPLLSLPLIYGTTLETIPAQIPYIKVNPFSIQKWKDKVKDDSSKLKVGLVWAGSPTLKRSPLRECPLKMFSPLAYNDDITYYSLQKGKAAEQAKNPPEGIKFIDYTDEIHDFSDTAALIENLDLVISVDTATAHLAGAMGKPVWTLLPFASDWRWMLNREDSPWYPTMRLFRQPSPKDWESVINSVLKELEVFIRDENR